MSEELAIVKTTSETGQRDDFSQPVKNALSKRASFICSNPGCRALTIAPAEVDTSSVLYIGVAAHITAAAEGGPRFDPNITAEQRKSIDNAIFLCNSCGTMIDKNNGADFPVDVINQWKAEHEDWIRENLNRSLENSIVRVSGEHHARGFGKVTGLEIEGAAVIEPGTISTAEGFGEVTGTRIGNRRENK